jgi:hypothetical protein
MTRVPPLLVLTLLAALAGCRLFQDEAETRALGFIETLVVDPANEARLRELAGGDNPRQLAGDLPVTLGLDFLRARRAQGASVQFVATRVERPDNRNRTVQVLARADGAGGHVGDELAFDVALQRNDGWHILRVREAR